MSDLHFIKPIVEAALFASPQPLTLDQLSALFFEPGITDFEPPSRQIIRSAIKALQEDYQHHSLELTEVAGGFRFQVRTEFAPWIKRLWKQQPPRYSRALLETLAIIAYRQPITRHDIENIRGITVSSEIIKKLLEYRWIRILAYRDSPGHPALYGTTRDFLNHFNLKHLSDLPTLAELQTLNLQGELFEETFEEGNLIEEVGEAVGEQTGNSIPIQEVMEEVSVSTPISIREGNLRREVPGEFSSITVQEEDWKQESPGE